MPAGPINDLDQVFEDAQVKHRGMQIHPKSDARERRIDPRRAHADRARRRTDGLAQPGTAAGAAYGGDFEGNRGVVAPVIREPVKPERAKLRMDRLARQDDAYTFTSSFCALARFRIPLAATMVRLSA